MTPASASRRAVLAVVAPAAVALAPPSLPLAAGAGLSAALVALAVFGAERTDLGRLIVAVVAVAWTAWASVAAADAPSAVLSLALACGLVITELWPTPAEIELDARRGGDAELAGAVSAAVAGLGVLALAWMVDPPELGSDPIRLCALSLSALAPAWFSPRGRIALLAPRVVGVVLPLALLVAQLGGAGDVADPWFLAVGPLALFIGAELQGGRGGREPSGPAEVVLDNPGLALVGSFLVACLMGTVLLSMPWTAPPGRPLALVDAAFMAVSATCVTGLAVVDPDTGLTTLGQALLLLLIQVGGLGIMTFSAAAFVLFGRRMSLVHEAAAAELVGAEALSELASTLRRILWVTAGTEGLGALALTGLFFADGAPLPVAAWRGLFTAIAAFCNAGFAVETRNLVDYADNPLVLLVVGTMILVGGLGPPVVIAIPSLLRGRTVSLNVHLTVWATLALMIFPAAVIGASEWDRGLAGMPVVDRLVNAWFQSVTLRTAGFNSIDIADVTAASWLVMVLAMFVGGSPGSTAGGVKTTTFAVILLAVWAAIRGQPEVQVRGRRLSTRTIYQSISIVVIYALTAVFSLLALELTSDMAVELALFEVASALGTVGLTTGGTAELDVVGKIVIMATMFAGRVGPVTLFTLLSGAAVVPSHARYPEARLPVG